MLGEAFLSTILGEHLKAKFVENLIGVCRAAIPWRGEGWVKQVFKR